MTTIIALVLFFLVVVGTTANTLPASPQNMNVESFGFTPLGGSLTAIAGVKSVTLSPNPIELSEGSDGDFFDSVAGLTGLSYKLMLETNRQVEWHSLIPGVYGTVSYVVPDFRNGITPAGGGFTVALNNAFYVPGDEVNAHRALGTFAPHFGSYAPDGQTDPVTYTPL